MVKSGRIRQPSVANIYKVKSPKKIFQSNFKGYVMAMQFDCSCYRKLHDESADCFDFHSLALFYMYNTEVGDIKLGGFLN